MSVIVTILYEVILYILRYLTIGINTEILEFIKILSIEVLYNIILF